MGMTAVGIVVALLFLLGVAGSVLPFLPGAPLVFVGAFVYAVATGFDPVGPGRLAILGGLAALAYLLAYVGAAVGARRFGTSGWGVVGAVVGATVGVFFAPVGLLLGPLLGATAAELIRTRAAGPSLRGGVGAVIGFAVGVVGHFALAVAMIALFLWWVWQ
jgi:uncharacterized protein YqgC (DUF456 family)